MGCCGNSAFPTSSAALSMYPATRSSRRRTSDDDSDDERAANRLRISAALGIPPRATRRHNNNVNNSTSYSSATLARIARDSAQSTSGGCASGGNTLGALQRAGYTMVLGNGQIPGSAPSNTQPGCATCAGTGQFSSLVDTSGGSGAGSGANQNTVTLYNPHTCTAAIADPCTGVIQEVDNRKKKKCKYPTVIIKKCKKKDPCASKEDAVCQQKRCCPPLDPPLCTKLPPKRPNCYAGEPQAYETAYHTFFRSFDVGTSSRNDWNYFMAGDDFVADDGVQTLGPQGVTLNANVYTKTYPPAPALGPVPAGYLDHFKTFTIRNSQYCVPECGEIYGEMRMTASQNIDAGQTESLFAGQVFNLTSDPRPAYGTFTMIDTENWIAFHHILTNDTIYAAVESLPFGRPDQGGQLANNYSPFMSLTPLGRRNSNQPLDRMHRHGISFDRRMGVKWYIDGAMVKQQVLIGNPQTEAETMSQNPGTFREVQTQIRCVQFGMGNFSFMDGLNTGTGSIIVEVKNKQVGEPQRTLVNLRNVGHTTTPTDAGLAPSLGNSTYNRSPTEYVAPFSVNVPASARIYGQGNTVKAAELLIQYRC